MSNWIIFYITLLNWHSCWNGTISFETFVETEISCCAPRFYWFWSWESEPEILERSRVQSHKFWKRWCQSQIFYLRLCNLAMPPKSRKLNWHLKKYYS